MRQVSGASALLASVLFDHLADSSKSFFELLQAGTEGEPRIAAKPRVSTRTTLARIDIEELTWNRDNFVV